MLDAVNNVTGVNGAEAAIVRAQPAAASTENDVAMAKELTATAAPISPRLVFDPGAAAMVTEFVGKDGEVTTQVPSQAALAYLRAGLNANGQRDADPSAPAAVSQV